MALRETVVSSRAVTVCRGNDGKHFIPSLDMFKFSHRLLKRMTLQSTTDNCKRDTTWENVTTFRNTSLSLSQN